MIIYLCILIIVAYHYYQAYLTIGISSTNEILNASNAIGGTCQEGGTSVNNSLAATRTSNDLTIEGDAEKKYSGKDERKKITITFCLQVF